MKTPQIPKSKKTQAAPWKVQHRLHRSPRNFRQKFRTQAEQNFVANYLFKLPHDFHIYNEKGKKGTIENLLMGGDSNTWWKAFVDELGRLANVIDN